MIKVEVPLENGLKVIVEAKDAKTLDSKLKTIGVELPFPHKEQQAAPATPAAPAAQAPAPTAPATPAAPVAPTPPPVEQAAPAQAPSFAQVAVQSAASQLAPQMMQQVNSQVPQEQVVAGLTTVLAKYVNETNVRTYFAGSNAQDVQNLPAFNQLLQTISNELFGAVQANG